LLVAIPKSNLRPAVKEAQEAYLELESSPWKVRPHNFARFIGLHRGNRFFVGIQQGDPGVRERFASGLFIQ
jgi:hypothetical protein